MDNQEKVDVWVFGRNALASCLDTWLDNVGATTEQRTQINDAFQQFLNSPEAKKMRMQPHSADLKQDDK